MIQQSGSNPHHPKEVQKPDEVFVKSAWITGPNLLSRYTSMESTVEQLDHMMMLLAMLYLVKHQFMVVPIILMAHTLTGGQGLIVARHLSLSISK